MQRVGLGWEGDVVDARGLQTNADVVGVIWIIWVIWMIWIYRSEDYAGVRQPKGSWPTIALVALRGDGRRGPSAGGG